MILSIFALLFFYYLSKYIILKIKEIRIDAKNDNKEHYWMFTYDFKVEKKNSIFDRDSKELIIQKRKKNKLIVLLYLTHAAIFVYANYFLSQILILILK